MAKSVSPEEELDQQIQAFEGYCVTKTLRGYKKMRRLVKQARILCWNPSGRFGENDCGTCASCKLLRMIQKE